MMIKQTRNIVEHIELDEMISNGLFLRFCDIPNHLVTLTPNFLCIRVSLLIKLISLKLSSVEAYT